MEIDYQKETSNSSINVNTNTLFDNCFTSNDKNNTDLNSNIETFNIKPSLRFSYKAIKKPVISLNETRLKKDINELKKNDGIEKICQIRINDYIKMQETNNIKMIVEFVDFFSLEFIFTSEYPFEPPIISYHSGNKIPLLFDSDGKIILEETKKQNWTPIIWLSGIIKSIEELLSKCPRSFIPGKMKYTKRKWDDYITEEKSLLCNENIINELNKDIRAYKKKS